MYSSLMPVIRMLTDMTGSRHDGLPWPGYHGLIDVPEWEAQQLVGGRNAEYPNEPPLDRSYDVLKAPALDYEDKLNLADGTPRDPESLEDFLGEELAAKIEDSRAHTERLIPLDLDDDDFDRDEPEELPEIKKPYSNAKVDVWRKYVVDSGFAAMEDVAHMPKAQLIAEWG